MKEAWIPGEQETQSYEGKQPTSHPILEKASNLLRTARQKSGIMAAGLIAAASVGYAGCGNVEFQSPVVFRTPTSTPAPTPTPEPTLAPTLVPRTPEPTPTKIPTPTIIPTATPSPTETPKPPPTATPEPPPTKTPPPTKKPEKPTPTPRPTPTPTPLPPPTPIPVLISEREIGTESKLTRCFDNTTAPTKRISIDFGTTGIEINRVKFKGYEKYLKTEIKVPKTQEELEREREREKKRGRDPNKIETKKIVSEGSVFDVDPGSACADLRIQIRSGSDRDCYSRVNFNFVNRESGFNGRILESETLFQNFCIGGVLEGTFEPKGYEYKPDTNTVIAYARIDNPDQDTPQETKVKLVKPCSFLDAAGREIVDNSTNEPISLNKHIKIPPKTSVWLRITSKMPFGKPPAFPLECTVELDRVLEK